MRGMFLAVGLLVVASFTTTTVEAQTCTESTLADFDYQVEASDDVNVYWTVDVIAEEVTFQVEYTGEGWVGLGFSADGEMVPGDCVIGLPDDSTALEYIMDSRSLAGVTEAATQEVSQASITQSGTTTTLVFTRPLAPVDSDKVTLTTTVGEDVFIIWGYGTDNTLAHHSDKGSVEVSDILCTSELALDTDDTADDDATADDDGGLGGDVDGDYDDDDFNKRDTVDDDLSAGVEDDDFTAGVASACRSSDQDYTYEYVIGSLSLFWSIVDDSSVSVKAVYDGEGYVSIGFSDSGSMPGADSVVGLPDEGTVLEYDMPSYSTPTEASEQELSETGITQADGTTTLTFVRPLVPTGEDKQVLGVSETTSWLYAWGSSNDFEKHTSEGSVDITLGSCDVSSSTPGSSKEFAHGWLMVLGWSVFMPLGIIAARFSGDFPKIGFPVHRALQSLGALMGIIAFIIIVVHTSDEGKDHFADGHGMLGLVLTTFVVIQVVAAVFRPSAPKKAGVDEMGNVVPAQRPSCVRTSWSWGHRLLGYFAVILAVRQCFTGFDELGAEDVWQIIYTAVVAIIGILFVLLQIITCFKSGGGRGVRLAGDPSPKRNTEQEPPQVVAHAGTI